MMSLFYIKCESKIGLLFTAALGLFASLWTNCIFVICIKKNLYLHRYDKDNVSYEHDLILKTIQSEYLLIVAISIMSLFWGIRRGITTYFLPWACLKVCECVVLFFSIELIFNDFDGLIPFALLSFGLNIYTSLCTYRVYKKIQRRTVYENQVNEAEHQAVDDVPPPSYEIAVQPAEAVVVETAMPIQEEQSTVEIPRSQPSRAEVHRNS